MAILTAKDVIKHSWKLGRPRNTIPLFRGLNDMGKTKSLYLDFEQWYNEELLKAHKHKAIVYTASVLKLTPKCSHLICAKLDNDNSSLFPKTRIRKADNIHTKLYILKPAPYKVSQVWVGSGNLVSSKGWHNIMVKVTDKHDRKILIQYFDNLWKLAGCV